MRFRRNVAGLSPVIIAEPQFCPSPLLDLWIFAACRAATCSGPAGSV